MCFYHKINYHTCRKLISRGLVSFRTGFVLVARAALMVPDNQRYYYLLKKNIYKASAIDYTNSTVRDKQYRSRWRHKCQRGEDQLAGFEWLAVYKKRRLCVSGVLRNKCGLGQFITYISVMTSTQLTSGRYTNLFAKSKIKYNIISGQFLFTALVWPTLCYANFYMLRQKNPIFQNLS